MDTQLVGNRPRVYLTKEETADLRARIREFLTCSCVDPVSAGEIGLALRIPAETAGAHCCEMARSGAIQSIGQKRGRRYFVLLA